MAFSLLPPFKKVKQSFPLLNHRTEDHRRGRTQTKRFQRDDRWSVLYNYSGVNNYDMNESMFTSQTLQDNYNQLLPNVLSLQNWNNCNSETVRDQHSQLKYRSCFTKQSICQKKIKTAFTPQHISDCYIAVQMNSLCVKQTHVIHWWNINYPAAVYGVVRLSPLLIPPM